MAATIAVDGTTCTLVDAITAANTDASAGSCSAGSGADTIALAPGSAHALTAVNNTTYGPTGLPVITSPMTIGGNSLSTITRDSAAPLLRILVVGASGNLTLRNTTVSGGVASLGGGIQNLGTLTLEQLSTVSFNTAVRSGGGIYNYNVGTVILGSLSTVLGNRAYYGGGGIENRGTLTLEQFSTVAGNTAFGFGGGIENSGTLALNFSTVSGNTVAQITLLGRTVAMGGGIFNSGYNGVNSTLTLTGSSITHNTADGYGGGIFSNDTLTLRSSTVSGNIASVRGGGVANAGTVTFTNSTVARNFSGRIGGGMFNTGTVTLVQSLLSGNSARVLGPEAYNASGTVIGDSFNLFGYGDLSRVVGFTLGATGIVPTVSLPAVLDPTLSNNGGPTQTHGLVFGSPALDAVPGAGCATAIDQRGAPRPQDADGDTVPDCDIGAVERGLIPIQAEILSTRLDCRAAGCRVSVRCNLLEAECRNPIDITVRTAAVRAADGTLVRAPRRFRFAAGVTNIPPGGTQTMRLPLTRRGIRVVETTEKKRLKGLVAIRKIGASATATPISNTRVTLRLRRRR